jgi:N utilization substance protein B
MLRKRKTRELAMQMLFLWDSNGEKSIDVARRMAEEGTDDRAVGRSAVEMAEKTWDQREAIDKQVERLAPHWPPRRQPGVDRGLIRLAVWELTNADTPPKVVIDEAIELAKKFSTEQSPSFINGVLDAVLREHRALVAGVTTEKPATDERPAANDETRITNDESMTQTRMTE